jgi:uncharacterized protein with PQ loop repeat
MLLGQELSYIFAIISNVLFIFVFMPQLYKNYKNKNAEAISLSLLYCLILGDLFSIVSADYKHLNPAIIYSAGFHIFLDLIIVGQIIYYRYIDTSTLLAFPFIEERTRLLGDTHNLVDINPKYKKHFGYLTNVEFVFVLFSSLIVISTYILLLYLKDHILAMQIANILAWSATAVFITARVPQIILNYTRGSTEGLSLVSFIIINIANLFFFLSIIILMIDLPKNKELYIEFILYNIQWIAGATCTTITDLCIFYQFWLYRKHDEEEIDLD